MEKLKGAELLHHIESSEHATKGDMVRDAGYVTVKKDGSEAINFSAFYDAVFEAKGISMKFQGGSGKGSGGGRKLSNIGSVQKNGNFIVGNAYTKKAGIEPGAKYSIEIDDEKVITLIPA